ncbi:hypothetical protein LEN26_001040 [Aphanomyces euteiches]|nr:hypothetical protein AeMF1_001021 [Aphanomyces euteiches]KAH9162196.1 hypothetical protein LEN26_001040 [Aphanomyces euteiches]KAH9196324.1 hypothetical protein AeNC1_001678 [Aphanomyces euteiches]
MNWKRLLHPFRHHNKALETPLKPIKAITQHNEFPERTPECTPESSPVATFQLVAQPVHVVQHTVKQRTQVPVEIPREHLHSRCNCVGGKQVPYTRRQVKAKNRRVRRYTTISEETASDLEE